MLSGQHSVLVLRRRADDYVKDLLEVPEELQAVAAVVLAHQTPPDVRQLAAGDAQAAQATTRELTITDFVRILVREWEASPVDHDKDNRLRLAKAYRKSGWRREQDIV